MYVGESRALPVRIDVTEYNAEQLTHRELASLDERTLRDIGIDPGVVDYEMYQWFWRPPRDWRD